MTVNSEFAFLIGLRLSLNLPNVRQEREESECRSPGSPRCKSATGEADPGTAARACPESDSCPLGEGKEEDFKLIECLKLEERACKTATGGSASRHFPPGGPKPGKKPNRRTCQTK